MSEVAAPGNKQCNNVIMLSNVCDMKTGQNNNLEYIPESNSFFSGRLSSLPYTESSSSYMAISDSLNFAQSQSDI